MNNSDNNNQQQQHFDSIAHTAFFLAHDCVLCGPLSSRSSSRSSSSSFSSFSSASPSPENDLKIVRDTADCLGTFFFFFC